MAMAVGIRKPCCPCEARMPYTGAVSRSFLVSCGVKSERDPSKPARQRDPFEMFKVPTRPPPSNFQRDASDQELSLRLKRKEKLLGCVVQEKAAL